MRRKRTASPGALKFLLIAIALMVVFDTARSRFGNGKPSSPVIKTVELAGLYEPPPEITHPRTPQPSSPEKKLIPSPVPAWKANSVSFENPEGKPAISIIIDDLGEDLRHSKEALALPSPVTMALLPYPHDIAAFAKQARSLGHELIVHMPMEGSDNQLDQAGYVLKESMTPAEFEKILSANLGAFDGYVGINNHMGSRLTQNREAMNLVMAALKNRGLLFIDSRTIATSVAEETASLYSIPHAARDVFIDHDPSPDGIRMALDQVERTAMRKGFAIAIGHPKAATLAALKQWISTLKDKGFVLAPVSALTATDPPRPQTQAFLPPPE